MYEMLKEMIRPELLVLVPVLYIYGIALKKSRVADKHIPWLLGICSVVLSLLFLAATTEISRWQDGLLAVFSGVTQGVLCAGASVYVNQIVKQRKKDE